MKIVAIDQSFTHTAIVIFEDNKISDFFVIKSNKEEEYEDRIKFIYEEIHTHINGAEWVFLEGLSYGKNSVSARPLAGLFYYILIKLKEDGIKFKYYAPTSIKKFAVKGNADKIEMFSKIPSEEQALLASKNHLKTTGLMDLSDAYWIGRFGISGLN